MLSVYECGSVVPGCRFVAHGESRDDVLVIAIEHMHRVHEIDHLSESLKARIRAVIKETPARPEAP
jgi:predicted small metal-binding protein